MNKGQIIPSVNFHLWEPCNMRCKFCFATFQDTKRTILPKGHLPKEEAIRVVQGLADYGFEKITFAGGEPSLCPWLSELVITAKEAGMTTMIVTNGSGLSDAFLEKNKEHLDWITISIDSLNEDSNIEIGRAIMGKKAYSKEYYLSMIERVKNYGYGLKINTVVNRYNYKEDMFDFIQVTEPRRWKVFQVLSIMGENDKNIERYAISGDEFKSFLQRHKHVSCLIPEDNSEMTGSYVMVDPAGRFYNNENGSYTYSQPILDVGAQEAIQEMDYNLGKFLDRGGLYKWS